MNIKVKGIVKFHKTIEDMGVWEVGYVVPWAYNPTTNILNVMCSIESEPFGTASMKVTRNLDGYTIEIPNDYRFSK